MTGKTVHKPAGQIRRCRYVTDIEKISQLSDAEKTNLREVTKKYPFRVTDYYLNLINWDNPDDPLRRLVIPRVGELSDWGFLDASNESSVTVCKGVQHKYGTTVLVLLTEACSAFCRYCFRKRLFMRGNDEADHDLTETLQYIREHKEVDNVLLSGGDPLMLSTRKLREILTALREIDHLKIIRIGSKVPAYDPFRFIDDPELLEIFSMYSKPERRIYLMCHFDHPAELTAESREGIRLVQQAGVICVNQTPITRGISDDPVVMARLWNELSYMGIPQYYVFQCRPTAGNEPYAIPIVEVYFKVEAAKRRCSGLAKRIKYVMSHESGKIEIFAVDSNYIYLKYHRAKFRKDEQRFIICHRNDNAYWLEQLEPVEGYRNEFYRFEKTALIV